MFIEDTRPLKCNRCESEKCHIEQDDADLKVLEFAVCDNCGHRKLINIREKPKERNPEFDKIYKADQFRRF